MKTTKQANERTNERTGIKKKKLRHSQMDAIQREWL